MIKNIEKPHARATEQLENFGSKGFSTAKKYTKPKTKPIILQNRYVIA